MTQFCKQEPLGYENSEHTEVLANGRLSESLVHLEIQHSYCVRNMTIANSILVRIRRMVSSGMLRRVALVRTDVSKELRTSFIRVTRIVELGTTLAVTSNRSTLVFLHSVRRLLVTASVVS
jgi:hypothetical protein